MTQLPALPLGSWLKTDPWDDHVRMLNAKRFAPMLAHDKMPLEVTPIYFRLQRYEQANAAPPPAAPSTPQPAAEPQGGTPPAQQQPQEGPQPAAAAPSPQ